MEESAPSRAAVVPGGGGVTLLPPALGLEALGAALAVMVRRAGLLAAGEQPGLQAVLPRGAAGLVALIEVRAEGREPSVRLGAVLEPAGDGRLAVEMHAVERDPDLPAAGALLAEAATQRRLAPGGVREARLRAYRPRRRAQIELCLADGRSLFAKVERRRAYRRTVRALRAVHATSRLAGRRGFALPAMVAADDALRCVVSAGVPGPRLLECLHRAPAADAQDVNDLVARVGADLRQFHARDTGGALAAELPEIGWAQARADLRRFGAAVRRIDPALAGRLAGAAAGLDAVSPASGRRGFVHRDLHDKQIIAGPRLTLLDLDGLSVGDPALDVGNLLAHLRLRMLQGRTANGSSHQLQEALLAGYELPWRGAWRRACLSWEAMTLARLAMLYALRPAWRYLATDLARTAQALLGAAHERSRSETGTTTGTV